MRKSIFTKVLFFILLTVSFTSIITNSYNEQNNSHSNITSSEVIKLNQYNQFTWNTNNSRLEVTILQDFPELNVSQNYTLYIAIKSLFLSSNISNISGIRIEVRFNYLSDAFDFEPMFFENITSINKTIYGSTNIQIPFNLDLPIVPSNTGEIIGSLTYKLYFTENFIDSKKVDFVSDWFYISLTVVYGLKGSKIPPPPLPIVPILGVGAILLVGVLSLIFYQNRKSKRESIEYYIPLNQNVARLDGQHSTKYENSKEDELYDLSSNLPEQSQNPVVLQENLKDPSSKQAINSKIPRNPQFSCPNCQKMIDKSSQFCPECGKVVEKCNICKLPIEQGSETINCPKCERIFHLPHYIQFVEKSKSCPICRETIEINKQ